MNPLPNLAALSPVNGASTPGQAALWHEGAERALLGSLMSDTRRIIDVRGILAPNDMYLVRHEHILRTIYAQYDEVGSAACDIVSVGMALRKSGRYQDVGGVQYLTELMGAGGSPSAVEHYARDIIEASARRRLLTETQRIQVAALRPDANLDILRADLEAAIGTYTTRDQGEAVDMELLAALTLERVKASSQLPAGVSGLSTGFGDLDDVLDGIQPRSLNIVAGRPGMGKTALALVIALKIAQRGEAVYIASLEMSRAQVTERLLSTLTGINAVSIRRGLRPGGMSADQYTQFQGALAALGQLHIYIDDVPAVNTAYIDARVERIARRKMRPSLIVVDYLQLMTAVDRVENRTLEVGSVARGLKNLAGSLDIPILAAAQINREVENRADKRPHLSDLRESGEIEQAADTVGFLYRDVVYNPETTQTPTLAEFNIEKNRHGALGRVHFAFDAACTRFSQASVKRVDWGAL